MIKENMTMNMRMNEMKILFMFGCPNREATVTRLRYAAALAVDPAAKKQMMELSSELDNDFTDEQYRNYFYNLRARAEYSMLRQYQQDYRNRQSVAERLDKIRRR